MTEQIISQNEVRERQLKDLQGEIWQIATWLRSSGLNTLQYIEQITDLLYLKMLDDEEIKIEKENELKKEIGLSYKEYSTRLGEKSRRFYNFVEEETDYVSFLDKLYNELAELPDYNGVDNSGIRKIFRRSNLLVRNNATLSRILFKLKEIKLAEYGFDVKGAVYEFLLSKMQSEAGQLGQFFTPRHIVDAMIQIANPKQGEKIYDPACGTGAFLTRAFKHVSEQMKNDVVTSEAAWDYLRKEQFVGRDISETTIKICTMNMMLHGDGHTRIMNTDSLSNAANQVDQHGQFDVILANPPFGSSAIPTDELYKFPIKTNNPENLFLQHIFLSLKEGGRAVVVVPEGILFRGGAEKKLRQMLLEQCNMEAVISLPAGCFQPYTGVKTSILVFTKGQPTEKVWFYNVENDGFDLTANRRPISQDDIPDLLNKIEEKVLSENSLIVDIEELKESDYSLISNRYIKYVVNSEFTRIALKEVVDFKNGYAFKSDSYVQSGIPLVTIKNINDNKIDLKNTNFIEQNEGFEKHSKFLIKESDLLITLTGSLEGNGQVGKVAFATKEFLPALLNQRVASLTVKDSTTLKPKFLFFLLSSEYIKRQIVQKANGAVQKNVSIKDIELIEIPLPPLHIQEEYVKRLEAQEEIIKSTTNTIESLRKNGLEESLFNNVVCEEYQLQEISNIINGTSISSTDYVEEGVQILRTSNIKYGKIDLTQKPSFISNENATKYNRLFVRPEDILVSLVGTTGKEDYGHSALHSHVGNFIVYTGSCIVRSNTEKVLQKYLYYYMSHKNFIKEVQSIGFGARLAHVSTKSLGKLTIKTPSIEDQEKIISIAENINNTINLLESVNSNAKEMIESIISELFN